MFDKAVVVLTIVLFLQEMTVAEVDTLLMFVLVVEIKMTMKKNAEKRKKQRRTKRRRV